MKINKFFFFKNELVDKNRVLAESAYNGMPSLINHPKEACNMEPRQIK